MRSISPVDIFKFLCLFDDKSFLVISGRKEQNPSGKNGNQLNFLKISGESVERNPLILLK